MKRLPKIGSTITAYENEEYTIVRYEKVGVAGDPKSEIIAIGQRGDGVEHGVDSRPADADECELPDGERETRNI